MLEMKAPSWQSKHFFLGMDRASRVATNRGNRDRSSESIIWLKAVEWNVEYYRQPLSKLFANGRRNRISRNRKFSARKEDVCVWPLRILTFGEIGFTGWWVSANAARAAIAANAANAAIGATAARTAATFDRFPILDDQLLIFLLFWEKKRYRAEKNVLGWKT